MENRDRDRETSKNIGNQKDDSSPEFGQKIGRSDNLDEPNSRQRDSVGESGMESSSGREDSGSIESESNRSSSRSNLGENVSRRSETEH